MRRLLLLAAIAGGGILSAREAKADDIMFFGPESTSVTWPSVMPPGWYTDTYCHAWYFPWYAYYNFSQGPYANWPASGGYAGYAYHGPAGYFYYPNKQPAQPYHGAWFTGTEAYGVPQPYGTPALGPDGKPMPPPKQLKEPKDLKEPKGLKEPKDLKKEGEVSVTLPANAKLLFNGVAASGSGNVRTFLTPPLAVGQSYKYVLTAEVVRDGRTERVSETVIVRAGEKTTVTLTPSGVTTASAK